MSPIACRIVVVLMAARRWRHRNTMIVLLLMFCALLIGQGSTGLS